MRIGTFTRTDTGQEARGLTEAARLKDREKLKCKRTQRGVERLIDK